MQKLGWKLFFSYEKRYKVYSAERKTRAMTVMRCTCMYMLLVIYGLWSFCGSGFRSICSCQYASSSHLHALYQHGLSGISSKKSVGVKCSLSDITVLICWFLAVDCDDCIKRKDNITNVHYRHGFSIPHDTNKLYLVVAVMVHNRGIVVQNNFFKV